MSTEKKKLLRATSALSVTSSEGTDDYVDVKTDDYTKLLKDALKVLETKESKEEKKTGTVNSSPDVLRLFQNGVGVGKAMSLQDVKVKCVYDFVITPSTSSAIATWQSVSVYSDAQVSSYFKYLWQTYRVDKATLSLDFHQYMNMVGVSDKVSAMGISFRRTTSTAIPGYTGISDDGTFRLVNWSQAKPIYKFTVSPAMLRGVGFTNVAEMASSQAVPVWKWCPLDREMAMGYIHVCSQDTFCAGTTGRSIVGRLAVWVTLRGRL